MKDLNIAVIGLGRIAQVIHLPLISSLSNVYVTAVSDINKNTLKSISDKFGVKKTYLDHREIIKNEDVDLIIVSTPTSSHRDVALDCIESGKNLLIEKPVARSYSEAKEILELAKKQHISVSVGMNMRFRPDIMLLKSVLSSDDIGTPFFIRCRWFRKQSSDSNWFVKKEEAGGGVLYDLGIVILDISLWLLDFVKVDSVSTQNYSINTQNVEDTSISFLRCDNGTTISIETSWSIECENDSLFLEIYGSKGSISLTPQQVNKVINNRKIELTSSNSSKIGELYKKSYLNQLKFIIHQIKNEIVNTDSLEQSVFNLKIIEKMYESAAQKEELKA